MYDITIGMVFAAGIATFVSPCFLPLIPIYIGFLTGEATDGKMRHRVIKNSLGFILGFTIIFVILGVSASGLGHILGHYRKEISKVLGIIVILMGLFYMELIKIKFLSLEKRFDYRGKKNNFTGAMIFGMALAFGWTPCIGSILAAVLSLAASRNSYLYGTYLLLIYSLGLAVPFLITSILIDSVSGYVKKIMKYTKLIKVVTGIIIILSGILIYTGDLGKISKIFL